MNDPTRLVRITNLPTGEKEYRRYINLASMFAVTTIAGGSLDREAIEMLRTNEPEFRKVYLDETPSVA